MPDSGRVTRSLPWKIASPVTWADVPLSRPMRAWLVTDFPEPDSPTMPRVWPRSSVKSMPFTAATTPSSVGNFTERFRTSRKAPVLVAWGAVVGFGAESGWGAEAATAVGLDWDWVIGASLGGQWLRRRGRRRRSRR